jgi:hypothetical protein
VFWFLVFPYRGFTSVNNRRSSRPGRAGLLNATQHFVLGYFHNVPGGTRTAVIYRYPATNCGRTSLRPPRRRRSVRRRSRLVSARTLGAIKSRDCASGQRMGFSVAKPARIPEFRRDPQKELPTRSRTRALMTSATEHSIRIRSTL